MNIEIQEVLAEMQNQFPKELTICIQAVQLRKYQQHEQEHTHDETDSDPTD